MVIVVCILEHLGVLLELLLDLHLHKGEGGVVQLLLLVDDPLHLAVGYPNALVLLLMDELAALPLPTALNPMEVLAGVALRSSILKPSRIRHHRRLLIVLLMLVWMGRVRLDYPSVLDPALG